MLRVLKQGGTFVIIDYVNEICDMRLKSLHLDGVPDEIVQKNSRQIAAHVKTQISGKLSC